MKNNKLLLCLLLLLPINSYAACNCEAEEEEDDGVYKSYNYVGVKAGTQRISDQSVLVNNRTGYGVFMGTRFSKLFAVEFEYLASRSFTLNTGATLKEEMINISFIHHLNLSDSVSIFGKLGLGYSTTTSQLAGNNYLTDGIYGLGIEMNLNKDMDTRIGIDRYRLNLPAGVSAENNLTYASAAYRF